MNGKILIVEDARELAKLLSDYLVGAGFSTTILHDGYDVINYVKQEEPSLILLDLMLPGVDGITICRELRTFSKVPIIMVTARIEEQDRLTGLDIGADDYVCKPFSPREVVARVKAVLRRIDDPDEIKVGNELVVLDLDKLQATVNGQLLSLTVVEFHLLRLLVGQPGTVFSRAQLIESIYPDRRIVGDRTVDSHVKKLRKKIGVVCERELIHSVYSAGYKFEII